MEHHTGATGLVEVQTVVDDDVEEVRDGQCFEPVVLEVVGGDEVLAAAAGGQEDSALAVVVPSVRNCSVRNGWVVPPLRRFNSIA